MWMATPSSRATASAKAISPGSQRLGSARWRLKTPIRSPKKRIGVAKVAFVPRSSRDCGLPRLGSAISVEASTSSTATVRRSRAARFMAGSSGAASPTGPMPGAFHSARTGIGSPSPPSLTKQRVTPSAFAVSSTATCRTSVRSSSERTRLPISATRRSRSSAARSASPERALPSASAASPARPCTSSSSGPEKSRCSPVLTAMRTPTTSPSEKSGTKAALFAPTVSASERFTLGVGEDVVDRHRGSLAHHASRSRSSPPAGRGRRSATSSRRPRGRRGRSRAPARGRRGRARSASGASTASTSSKSDAAASSPVCALESADESREIASASRPRSVASSSASRTRRRAVTSSARSWPRTRTSAPGTATAIAETTMSQEGSSSSGSFPAARARRGARDSSRDDGEEEPDPEAEHGRPALAQHRHAQEHREEAVEAGEDQERDGVDEHRLTDVALPFSR